MIYGNNLADLATIAPKAYRFLQENDATALEAGRHELGDGDYVNVIECTTRTREGAQYESHRNYYDVQVVLAGEGEACEVAPVASAVETQPYNEQDDYALQSGETRGERLELTPGRFLVLGSQDAHMPTLALTSPAPEKKAVFKLRVGSIL